MILMSLPMATTTMEEQAETRFVSEFMVERTRTRASLRMRMALDAAPNQTGGSTQPGGSKVEK